MKLELSAKDIEQVLVDFAGERMGKKFNQVTFYYLEQAGEKKLYNATVEYSPSADPLIKRTGAAS